MRKEHDCLISKFFHYWDAPFRLCRQHSLRPLYLAEHLSFGLRNSIWPYKCCIYLPSGRLKISEGTQWNRKKDILVEDEPVAKSLYQNRLQSEGFDVSIAGDGDAGFNELSNAQVDLVVLDLTLPKMKGEEAVKKIRANDRLKKAPVLVISNAYMTEMSQKAMEMGATRGLLKTECTPARLVNRSRDLLGFRSAFDLTNSPVTDDKSVEEFANAAERALADELKLKETREEFIKKAPSEISRIREHCRAYARTPRRPRPLRVPSRWASFISRCAFLRRGPAYPDACQSHWSPMLLRRCSLT